MQLCTQVCPPPSPAPTEIVFGDLIELAIECTSNDGVPLSYTWDVKRVYEAAIGYCLGANNLVPTGPITCCSSSFWRTLSCLTLETWK